MNEKLYSEIRNNPILWKKEIKRIQHHVKIWRAKNPEKNLAHRAVFIAVRNGTLKKKPCRRCGKSKVEAHHEDYSKPLKVVWLCKKHHVEADLKRKSVVHI
jgi:ribosomal protein S27AE